MRANIACSDDLACYIGNAMIGTRLIGPSRENPSDPDDRMLAFWKVRCVNSETKMLFDRITVLRMWTLPDTDREAILPLVTHWPTDPLILEHRSKFTEATESELTKLDEIITSLRNVHLPEYFEDENGKSLDTAGLIRTLSA